MWNPLKNITWLSFGDRTVLWEQTYHITPSWRKILMEKCKCKCWIERFVQRQHLINWTSSWCWCEKAKWAAERLRKQQTKHWMEWSHPYIKYAAAKSRCEYPKNKSYYRYWWRWIKFEWNSFEEFWNDMSESYYEHIRLHWKNDTTLERIDINKWYNKENCRRATRKEQYRNMSNNHHVIYKWKEYNTISELAEEMWMKVRLIRDRLRLWWSIEDAVEKPLQNFKTNNANEIEWKPKW